MLESNISSSDLNSQQRSKCLKMFIKFPRGEPGVPVEKCGIPREVVPAAERSTNLNKRGDAFENICFWCRDNEATH